MLAPALALALFAAAAASAEVPVPALSARVTDLAGTLDAGERSALEAKLAAFERAKGSQVVVLIVPTTQPETIEQYSIRVADAWKIGRGGTIDDGVILLVAKDDRTLRIEVGQGLEGALPDAIAKRIIEEAIVPRFRVGDFYGGISDGVERITGVIEGEPLPPPSQAYGRIPEGASFWVIIVLPLVIGGLVRLAHNRASGALVAGGLSWGLGMWLIGASYAVLVIALFCGSLVLGANPSGGRGWSSRGYSGGFGGGGFGGGGGFSGGGGGFSGGGASGRW